MKPHIQLVVYQRVNLFHPFTACETVAKQTSTAARRSLTELLASVFRGPALFHSDPRLRASVKQCNPFYSNTLKLTVSCFIALVPIRETAPGNVCEAVDLSPFKSKNDMINAVVTPFQAALAAEVIAAKENPRQGPGNRES